MLTCSRVHTEIINGSQRDLKVHREIREGVPGRFFLTSWPCADTPGTIALA
jgi:hypothetical protein